MGRALLILNGHEARRKAADWIARAPVNTRVTFQGPKRSLDQNSKMWAALTDIATTTPWHGQYLSADDWKMLFLSALKQEMRLVQNLTDNGFVALGRSSSELSKEEMSNLLELILCWGAEHGVKFSEPAQEELANA
jgi:hypothetical protein